MLTLTPSFQGRVRMVKHKTNGEKTADISFDNVVLDAAITNLFRHFIEDTDSTGNYMTSPWVRAYDYYWFLSSYHMDYLFLGTGTTEPTPFDTGLENRSPSLSGKVALFTGGDAFGSNRPITSLVNKELGVYGSQIEFTFRYDEGEAEGVWTELGLAESQSYNHPFSRALIRDENGNPISLTVLSDEYLTVFYTIRYIDGLQGSQTQDITIDGTTHTATLKTVQNEGNTGWDYEYSSTSGSDHIYVIWRDYWPLVGAAIRTSANPEYRYNTLFDIYDVGINTDTQKITFTLGINPKDNDYTIQGISLGKNPLDESSVPPMHDIDFDPPIVKKADYRLVFTLEILLNILGKEIDNVRLDDAQADSLTFAWDAYDATEYHVKLYRTGVLVDEQTVTGTSVTFTGLTSARTYDFDIYATGGARQSARTIIEGTTL